MHKVNRGEIEVHTDVNNIAIIFWRERRRRYHGKCEWRNKSDDQQTRLIDLSTNFMLIIHESKLEIIRHLFLFQIPNIIQEHECNYRHVWIRTSQYHSYHSLQIQFSPPCVSYMYMMCWWEDEEWMNNVSIVICTSMSLDLLVI